MKETPKDILIGKIDELDLNFVEGENEIEFEIGDFSFIVTYSLETDDIFIEDEESIDGGKKLKILSINAYDNVNDEDIYVSVDDDIQKLFSDYYENMLIDSSFEPLNVNFGKMEDFFND